MDLLRSFIQRVDDLEYSRSTDEAKALLGWVQAGNLAKLIPVIEAHLTTRATTTDIPVLEFETRPANSWETKTIRVFTSNTGSQLYDIVSREFKIPVKEFTLRVEDTYIPNNTTNLGIKLKSYLNSKESTGKVPPGHHIELVITPTFENAPWFYDHIAIPVCVRNDYTSECIAKFTIPAFEGITIGEIRSAIDQQQHPLLRKGYELWATKEDPYDEHKVISRDLSSDEKYIALTSGEPIYANVVSSSRIR